MYFTIRKGENRSKHLYIEITNCMHHHRFVYYSALVKLYRVLSRNIGILESLTDREFLTARVRSITIRRQARSIDRSVDRSRERAVKQIVSLSFSRSIKKPAAVNANFGTRAARLFKRRDTTESATQHNAAQRNATRTSEGWNAS